MSLEEGGGLKCELVIRSPLNSKGERMVLHGGIRGTLDPLPDKFHSSALVLTKFYDKDGTLEYTELEIRSPHIGTAICEVVRDYPDINLKTRRIVVRNCWKLLFHYRKGLQEYGKRLTDQVISQHLHFALQYPYKSLEHERRSY